MKIGLIAPYDWAIPGGVQRHITALDRAFRTAGHEVKIIAVSSSKGRASQATPPDLIRVKGAVVPVPVSGSRARISLSPRLDRQLKALLSQGRFDIVHLHEPLMPALCLLALYHAHVHPTTLAVGTFHAYRQQFGGYEVGRPVFGRLLARLDGRIAVSEAARGLIGHYFPGDYRLIPNGVDLARFGDSNRAPTPALANRQPAILFVGRLEKRKGFQHLLRAFKRVQAHVPAARLIVAGAFSRQQAEPLIRQVEAERLEGVEFVGWLPDEKLARLYQAVDVVCVPSTGFESFGLVLLEAMAAGRPVVASDIPGYREVVRDGLDGLLVPPGNEEALAGALLRLVTDGETRQRMGRNGRARAESFAWEQVAAQVLDYYSELLEQRG